MKLQNILPYHWIRNQYRKIIGARYEFVDREENIRLTVQVSLQHPSYYCATFNFYDRNLLKRQVGIKVNGNLLVSENTEERIVPRGRPFGDQRVAAASLPIKDFRTLFKEEVEIWDVTNDSPVELTPEISDQHEPSMEAVLREIEAWSHFATCAY